MRLKTHKLITKIEQSSPTEKSTGKLHRPLHYYDTAGHTTSGGKTVSAWQTLTGLGEEGVESVVTPTDSLVRGHLPVGLDAMLQAVELPARVTFRVSNETWSFKESQKHDKKAHEQAETTRDSTFTRPLDIKIALSCINWHQTTARQVTAWKTLRPTLASARVPLTCLLTSLETTQETESKHH